MPKREIVIRLGLILLAGCPQLLDDEFESPPFDLGLPEPDAGGSDVGSSGAGGSAAGGFNVGGTGVGGFNVGGAGVGNAGPVVASAVPADGARGVLPDAELVFMFSAPMDTSSVQAAYVSSELPAAEVSFIWSEGDTVLRLQPRLPLRVATGSHPATVAAASYTIDFTSRAKDKAGNSLVAKHVNFTVARSITQQLDVVQDRDLTGNWRDDGSYGSLYCEKADTTFCMGDGVATYRAFVTFELGGVPSDLISISAAELSATVQEIFGDPFSALGALQLEHVAFGSIGSEAYSAQALSGPRSMSTGAVTGERVSAEVLADVQADFGVRARSQFRLYFAVATDSDAVADQIVCDWSSAHLTLSYLAP